MVGGHWRDTGGLTPTLSGTAPGDYIAKPRRPMFSATVDLQIAGRTELPGFGAPSRERPTQTGNATVRVAASGSAPPSTQDPEGETMATIIGYHSVKDTDHWLTSPKREEVFGPLGVTNIRTFVDPQNRTRVAVLMDVADMDVLMGAMQSEGMAQAMEYDGVLPETLVILVEA